MKYYLGVLISICILSCSCSKNNQAPLQSEIQSCHDNQNLGLNEIREDLVGEWELVMTRCFSDSKREKEKATGFFVNFRDNGQLIITTANNSITTTTWQIEERFTNWFEIRSPEKTHELQGYIVLCDDRVESRLGYVDLCDYRFKRVN